MAAAGPPADAVLALHCPTWREYTSYGQYWGTRMLLGAPPGSVTLTVLPTASGKTLTYLLALLEAKSNRRAAQAIVITPTISLMSDVVDNIRTTYIPTHDWQSKLTVEAINSLVGFDEQQTRLDEFVRGEIDILYLSPEKALQSQTLAKLRKCGEGLEFLIVDEAHLIADWGAQFRPEFQRLGFLRRELLRSSPRLRTALLSATVSSSTQQAIRHVFQDVDGDHWRVVRDAPLRLEAHLAVDNVGRTRDDSRSWLEARLPELETPALVYVTTRVDAEEMGALVTAFGKRTAVYHGETDGAARERIIQQWRKDLHEPDALDVIVATSAFGLGIDKPDVRTVLHLCIPESLDRLYQEIGRAGRDGRYCTAILGSVHEDVRIAEDNILTLLKTENLRGRLDTMVGLSRVLDVAAGGATYVLDEQLVPTYRQDPLKPARLRGHNEGWNKTLLNFLQRWGIARYEGGTLAGLVIRLLRSLTPEERRQFDVFPALATSSGTDGSLIEVSVFGAASGAGGNVAIQTLRDLLPLNRDLFEVREWIEGSIFWFPDAFHFGAAGTDEELEAWRERELAHARAEMQQAIAYAREPQRLRCLREPFAEAYGLDFVPCGRCANCHERGVPPAQQPETLYLPAPWPADGQQVQPLLQSLHPESIVLEPSLDAAGTPLGALRIVPLLRQLGVRQYVFPDAWEVHGVEVLHTVDAVLSGHALLEALPTAVFVPASLSVDQVRQLDRQFTGRIRAGTFSASRPVLWIIGPSHPVLNSFVERRDCEVRHVQDLVREYADERGVQPGPSLNIETWPSFPARTRKVTPEQSRRIWIEEGIA